MIKITKDTPIGQSVILTPEDIGTWKIVGEAITITTNKVPEGETWYIRSVQTINSNSLIMARVTTWGVTPNFIDNNKLTLVCAEEI